MTKIISVEEIGLCRSGPNNDIDLQAVFGGIKGRKQKGLKLNPVYDSNHGNIQNSSQDINGNISNVQVVTYTSIPDSHTSTTSDTSKLPSSLFTEHRNGESRQRNPEDNHNNSNGNSGNSIKNETHLVHDNVNESTPDTGSHGSTIGNKENNLSISNGNQNDINELSDISLYEIKENMNSNERKQVKEDINKNGIVLGVNGIMKKKNGSMNRETIGLESKSIKTKPISIPVLLSKVDKIENDFQDHVVKIENIKNKALEKRGSGYELLGYNNEGYIADETSIHLETVDDDANTRKNANSEDNLLEIVNNQLHGKDNQVNPIESDKESKKSKGKNVMESEPVDDSKERNENYKATNCVESVENPSKVVVRTISSFSSTSEQSMKTEIVTEVHVHREDTNQNQTKLDTCNQDLSNESSQNEDTFVENHQTGDSQASDRLNSEMQEVTDHLRVIDNLESSEGVSGTNDSVTHLTNKESSTTQVNKQVEDIIDTEKEVNVKQTIKGENIEVLESSKTVTFSDTELQEYSESNGYKTNTSSTRTLKSILLTSNGKQHTPPDSPNNEQRDGHEMLSDIKTVKFSEDTVFNENKSKRYKLDKMEKINLREIYRGKISCDSAMAKMNPIFHDDMESQDIEKSMSEDEKLAYQIALKKMMKSTSKGKDPTSPAYRDHYLILKANGIRPSNSSAEEIQTDIEKPAYDRLIQRTIAKERRKLIVKWVLVILVVAIVTTIATVLGVHFK